MRETRSIDEVVAAHLCLGCGACAFLADGRLQMQDVHDVGLRPLPIASVNGRVAGAPLAVCPGRDLGHTKGALDDAPLRGEWGPILALYECWSSDPDVRYRGSSGGVATALSAHAVTSGRATGALQVQADATDPLRNETVLNTTYESITAATGSRYAPASPCERLDLIEAAHGTSVFVGKPCDDVGCSCADGREESGGHCGHARGERDCFVRVFEFGQGRLEACDTGLPQALVDGRVAVLEGMAGSEPFVGVTAGGDIVDWVGGREVDGRNVDSCLGEAFHSAVDHESFWVQ